MCFLTKLCNIKIKRSNAYLKKIVKILDNAYTIFSNMKVVSSFLDIAFENYTIKGKEEETTPRTRRQSQVSFLYRG